MIEDIIGCPGTRSGIENIALAVLMQAAKDLSAPTTAPAAMEWFLSDEYREYSRAFGLDADALFRQIFHHRYPVWKRWNRTLKTFRVVQHINGKQEIGIGALVKNHKLMIICCPERFYICQSIEEAKRLPIGRDCQVSIEWTES